MRRLMVNKELLDRERRWVLWVFFQSGRNSVCSSRVRNNHSMKHTDSFLYTVQWSNLCLGSLKVKRLVEVCFHPRGSPCLIPVVLMVSWRWIFQGWTLCTKEKSNWKLVKGNLSKGVNWNSTERWESAPLSR